MAPPLNKPFLTLVNPPYHPFAPGTSGFVSLDSSYFYVFSNGKWCRTAISTLYGNPPMVNGHISNGLTCFDQDYFYIYWNNRWNNIAFSPLNANLTKGSTLFNPLTINILRIIAGPITTATNGQPGNVSYDSQYFYINAGKLWRKFSISNYTA